MGRIGLDISYINVTELEPGISAAVAATPASGLSRLVELGNESVFHRSDLSSEQRERLAAVGRTGLRLARHETNEHGHYIKDEAMTSVLGTSRVASTAICRSAGTVGTRSLGQVEGKTGERLYHFRFGNGVVQLCMRQGYSSPKGGLPAVYDSRVLASWGVGDLGAVGEATIPLVESDQVDDLLGAMERIAEVLVDADPEAMAAPAVERPRFSWQGFWNSVRGLRAGL